MIEYQVGKKTYFQRYSRQHSMITSQSLTYPYCQSFCCSNLFVISRMGHFFYDRVNIWQTATIQGSGDPQSDSLGAGHVPANTPIHLTINPEDCRAVCCYVQEDYHPYPSCKLYCDNAICLECTIRVSSQPSSVHCF